METMRLRKIQVPAKVERLLDAVIFRAKLTPEDGYQIRDPDSLSILLRSLAKRATQEGKAWSAWGNGQHTWLYTAEMSLPRSRKVGKPVLLIAIYGHDGQLQESAPWVSDREGNWSRCE